MGLRPAHLVAGLLLFSGLLSLGQGLYIPAKAQLAQWLLDNAWQQARSKGVSHPPWPWADGYPVARLRWSDGDINQIVLSNASARGMAFGPGHVGGSARPGQPGHIVLTAHRDTHFSFLGKVVAGDEMDLEHAKGLDRYRVVASQVIDLQQQAVELHPERNQLTLVTCWPLHAWRSGGTQRLLVHLQRLPGPGVSTGFGLPSK